MTFECVFTLSLRTLQVTTVPGSELPTFTLSGVKMTTLICEHWSNFWSIQHLRKYILEPAQGTNLSISDDGSKAYIQFENPLSAMQAKQMCEQACKKVLLVLPPPVVRSSSCSLLEALLEAQQQLLLAGGHATMSFGDEQRGGGGGGGGGDTVAASVLSKVESWLPQVTATKEVFDQSTRGSFDQSYASASSEASESEQEADEAEDGSEASVDDSENESPPSAIQEDEDEDEEDAALILDQLYARRSSLGTSCNVRGTSSTSLVGQPSTPLPHTAAAPPPSLLSTAATQQTRHASQPLGSAGAARDKAPTHTERAALQAPPHKRCIEGGTGSKVEHAAWSAVTGLGGGLGGGFGGLASVSFRGGLGGVQGVEAIQQGSIASMIFNNSPISRAISPVLPVPAFAHDEAEVLMLLLLMLMRIPRISMRIRILTLIMSVCSYL